MSKTRYAIVRVNFVCPNTYEGISYKFVCQNNGPIKNFQCEKCRYGDTKEQFTRKIETAIEIAINRYEEGKIKGRNKNRQCAEIIVDFLGVE